MRSARSAKAAAPHRPPNCRRTCWSAAGTRCLGCACSTPTFALLTTPRCLEGEASRRGMSRWPPTTGTSSTAPPSRVRSAKSSARATGLPARAPMPSEATCRPVNVPARLATAARGNPRARSWSIHALGLGALCNQQTSARSRSPTEL
eukprot:3931160-Prymnesium_polylepis.4